MQQSFSRLWDGHATDKAALQARNARAKALRAEGYTVRCFTLANQCRKYAGLGEPDGRSCNCYFVDYDERFKRQWPGR